MGYLAHNYADFTLPHCAKVMQNSWLFLDSLRKFHFKPYFDKISHILVTPIVPVPANFLIIICDAK